MPSTGIEENVMVFDYSLAALVALGLLIYLIYALLRPANIAQLALGFDGFLVCLTLIGGQLVHPIRGAAQDNTIAPVTSPSLVLQPIELEDLD
jgi:K+-transporting ATPase KdpF subunit